LRTIECPNCMLCHGRGKELFSPLTDRLFGGKGEWGVLSCTNKDCGLVWLSPQPVVEDIGEAYSDYYTHKPIDAEKTNTKKIFEWLINGYVANRYGAKITTNYFQTVLSSMLYLLPGKRSVIDFKSAELNVIQGGNLLEIGCGSGDSLIFLKSLGWNTTGIEIDPKSAEVARGRGGLNVLNKPLNECRFLDATFNAIVMNHVIEHLHNPTDLLVECLRVLKVGGSMVIVTPNTRSLLYRFFGYAWMHLDPPRHLYLYNSQNLMGLATSVGFEVNSLHTSIRDANSVYLASRSISTKGSYRMDGKKSFFAMSAGYVVQLLEWLILKFDKNAGEEIVMILVKR